MILKKLEIAGFKSFGKPVTLAFSVPITAVVGPNGSGKSNVAEALRWVLGEQSIKSLRGKRGEDLIFHGSGGGASQLGKAKVSIMFDNSSKILPLDFEEVEVSREVYRDGVNDYRVNGSSVRLKDIVDLMSNVGIGGSGHHIISQGEADRVLYANPKERKNMIEDALGLRIYHLKRAEAERKLASTQENMREVSLLRREIQPHIRFLKEQVLKVEASEKLRRELSETVSLYIAREHADIEVEQAALLEKTNPLQKTYQDLERQAADFREALNTARNEAAGAMPERFQKCVIRLEELEAERQILERRAGRLEGELAVLLRQKKAKPEKTFLLSEVKELVSPVLHDLSSLGAAGSLEEIKKGISRVREMLERFFSADGAGVATRDAGEEVALAKEREEILADLSRNESERTGFLREKKALERARDEGHKTLFETEAELRKVEEKMYRIKDALLSFEIHAEQVRLRREELEREEEEAGESSASRFSDKAPLWQAGEREKIRRDVQRLRVRLEEAGGVDPQVVEEYRETEERDNFLSRELEDLEKTTVSLEKLMKELAERLTDDFTKGVTKINKEFTRLFETMFGGGSAKLTVVALKQRGSEDEEGEVDGPPEEGIEIAVDIPHKRVRHLDILSGGERALTSIALLFAMSFVNPPPFLVLDETDAALDEANSQRYGTMLRNLSGKTQLIVITHNRQTMKEAGVLYGVTMGSDGVSRLLSLKFEEAAQVSGKPHEV